MKEKIGIAGIGGIGSNVAAHLVRSGIRELRVIDYDFVDSGNLNRQFFFHNQIGMEKTRALEINLRRIMPGITIEKYRKHLSQENLLQYFGDCTIIIDGFDKPEDKAALLETFAGSDKYLVCASGVAGFNIEDVKIRHFGNAVIIGDFASGNCSNGFYSPKIGFVAAIMANLVLKKLGFEASCQAEK